MLAVLIFLSGQAFGQEEYDYLRARDQYDGYFSHNGQRQLPRLKTDITAAIRPGASVYRNPENAMDPKNTLSSMPWNYWRERCEWNKDQLSGRMLYRGANVTAIQLDRSPDFCGGYFNEGQADRLIVFVPSRDVVSALPRGEERTEASAAPQNCPDCHDDQGLAALRTMANAVQSQPSTNCQKTDEEIEKYLDCHATPNQANYDKYYRKLFDLAGSTFKAAYHPSFGLKAILKPEDWPSSGKEMPFSISAKSSVMKCIALRESQWDPTKESDTGAKGIGQQTETNVEHIRCLLKGICKEKKKGKVVQVKRAPVAWAVSMWKEYFRRVKAELSASEQARLFTNPVTGQKCRETMEDKSIDAPCPVNSIAAIALYQVEAELTIRRASSKNKDNEYHDFNPNELCQLQIVQGATNNAGTGTVKRAVKASLSAEDWRGHLASSTPIPGHGPETNQFSLYIRNCLQAGNMNSMHPPTKGKRADDCSPYSKGAR